MIRRIVPLAFDSFGVRSMATFVETDDLKILIDPEFLWLLSVTDWSRIP
jgi:predicted metallo-beta-lactamase superfamily hydrolase